MESGLIKENSNVSYKTGEMAFHFSRLFLLSFEKFSDFHP